MSTISQAPAVQARVCDPEVLSSFSYRARDAQSIVLGICSLSSSYCSLSISWYGYDTDEPTALRDVLKRIRGRGAAIEWLYPNKTVVGMSRCVRLARDLVKNWYSAGNLSEIDLSLRQLR